MISERQFSHNFTGFWRASLPNLEAVLRVLNLGPERQQKPYLSRNNPQRRDLISEVGFRLAAQVWKAGRLADGDVATAYQSAVNFLTDEADLGEGATFPALNEVETDEALHLCERIHDLVRSRGQRAVEFFPAFAGLGMLARCQGDILTGSSIIEVKYVDRAFRSTDLKQALTYAVLGRISGQTIDELIIYNPLRGTFIESTIADLVFGASGQSVDAFQFEFVQALTSSGVSR